MNPFPLICLLLQLRSAIASLPAPGNLRVESLNFRHVLHWEPGPGSPPGTEFRVFKWNQPKPRKPRLTTSTSYKLKLETMKMYNLAVQASYNHTQSPFSKNITFSPSTDTVIGPPLLSVAGCGTYIQVNISLPDADPQAQVEDIKTFFDAQFRVRWRKGKDGKMQELKQDKRSLNLTKLEKDEEYCVQVLTEIRTNKNTLPSEWKCTFTSIPEPQNGMLILVTGTTVLIFLVIVLTTGIFCLYYTGFLCKLKEMPAALMVVLWPDYILTLSSMDIDQVTIIPQVVKTRNCPSSTGEANSEDEDGDDEEEEGAGNHLYMDRHAELSSEGGSYQNAADNSGNLDKDAMKDSGGFMEKQPEEVESNQYEAKAEPVQVSFMRHGDQSELQVRGTEQEEIKAETPDFSGDVNLFSVTLTSLAACDEDEIEEDQDSESSSMDFLRIYTLKPLSQIDSESEQEVEISAQLTHPSEENFPGSGHDGSCTESWMEEEEEEEEYSGYLSNK